jgi:hypothetical protein
MTAMARALGVALAAATMLGLAWASTVPLTVNPSGDAVLRVAWSARPERVEECRSQSGEELARLPAHMRQAVICEGVAASYRLEVRHQGRLLAEQIVRGGGWRRDRRLYVFREFALPPGDARVEVRFDRIDAPAATPRDEAVEETAPAAAAARTSAAHPHDASRSRPRVEAVPAQLGLDRRLTLAPREVMLVTYDPASRRLAVGGGRRTPQP